MDFLSSSEQGYSNLPSNRCGHNGFAARTIDDRVLSAPAMVHGDGTHTRRSFICAQESPMSVRCRRRRALHVGGEG